MFLILMKTFVGYYFLCCLPPNVDSVLPMESAIFHVIFLYNTTWQVSSLYTSIPFISHRVSKFSGYNIFVSNQEERREVDPQSVICPLLSRVLWISQFATCVLNCKS